MALVGTTRTEIYVKDQQPKPIRENPQGACGVSRKIDNSQDWMNKESKFGSQALRLDVTNGSQKQKVRLPTKNKSFIKMKRDDTDDSISNTKKSRI